MHRNPQPQSQARMLVEMFAQHGVTLKYQDALEYVAPLNGYTNWQSMSAILKKQDEVSEPQDVMSVQEVIPGKPDDLLFSVELNIEVTMGKMLYVRAPDANNAVEIAQEFAAQSGLAGFVPMPHFHEGQAPADFYVPISRGRRYAVVLEKESLTTTDDGNVAKAAWKQGDIELEAAIHQKDDPSQNTTTLCIRKPGGDWIERPNAFVSWHSSQYEVSQLLHYNVVEGELDEIIVRELSRLH